MPGEREGEMEPVVRAARFAVAHAPGLVARGSKPRRECLVAGAELENRIGRALRSFDDAVAYPPNQVLIGNLSPGSLGNIPRPWHAHPIAEASNRGPGGRIVDQSTLYGALARGDTSKLLRLATRLPDPLEASLSSGAPIQRLDHDGLRRAVSDGAERLTSQAELVGVMLPAHALDESLSASVLLENLAAKVSGALALEDLLEDDPRPVDHLLGCGEEAVGDRYQRGGGNLAKAIGEMAGVTGAAGTDVKSFCAGPLHALVLAGALVRSGMAQRVVVVGGGSLAKLGMKFRGHLDAGYPILEDALVGVAIDVVADDAMSPHLCLDSATFHRIGEGSAPHKLAEALSVAPLASRGLGLRDVDRYGVELHDPDITEPAGSGDVPSRNYQVLAALAVRSGEIAREDMPEFIATRGMPGFCPTQGHIASAIPYLPHAISSLTRGDARRVQLVAKGSLFLGRMTGMSDGVSLLLEQNGAL